MRREKRTRKAENFSIVENWKANRRRVCCSRVEFDVVATCHVVILSLAAATPVYQNDHLCGTAVPSLTMIPTMTAGDHNIENNHPALVSLLKHHTASSLLHFRKLSIRGKVSSQLLYISWDEHSVALDFRIIPVQLCSGCINSLHHTCAYSPIIL